MSYTIGLFIDTTTGIGGYQEAVWLGVCDAAREKGIKVVSFASGQLEFSYLNPFEKTRNLGYELLSVEKFDGLIYCGATIGNSISAEKYNAFCDRFASLPSVSVGAAGKGIPRVLVDNDRGMKDIIKHLITDHTYTQIAFISGPRGNIDADRREAMYRETLQEFGMPIEERLLYEGDFNNKSGYDAVVHWTDTLHIRPQAIVASNDNMAFGALVALQERGLSVPYTVAITGFDDTKAAASSTPPLSTVKQPVYQQARVAFSLLMDKLDGKTIEFEVREAPEQVYRQSCGCLSAGLTAYTESNPVTASGADSAVLEALGIRGADPDGLKVKTLIAVFRKEPCDESAFIAGLNDLLQKDILANADISRWNGVLNLLRHDTPKRETLLHRAQSMVSESAQQQFFRQQDIEDREMAQLMGVERELITSFNMDNLVQIMMTSFPRLGIDGAALCLYDNPLKPLESAHIVSAFRNGAAVPFPRESFPTKMLLPESVGITENSSSPLIVEPIYYRDDQLGYLIFAQKTRRGLVYESLAGEICSAIEGAVLIERVTAAERQIEERSRSIEQLVRPMLESIQSVTAITADQQQEVSKLEDLNRKSMQAVTGMESNTALLSEALKKTGLLVTDINSISEVINVVAINASIEAAHVGSAGAGFAVISGEIRKLAESTRRNSAEITGFLKEVDLKISDLVLSNHELSLSFGELKSTIVNTIGSLENISARMGGLNRGSNEILDLMNKK